eukprot:TRINITY_DN10041_c0_g1_i1.p1 TRINITY_DN10041_c0_g1~~TRINITY_DN10041_c0_g1_i1.p1  ORF type:complete len:1770 (+),score=562.22 TRINITY_DN10041_c0_g1_i1:30-5339(+)
MTSSLPRIKEAPSLKTGESIDERNALFEAATHQALSASVYERYLAERAQLTDKLKSLHHALEETNVSLHSAHTKSESFRDLLKAYKLELETSAEIISEEKAIAEFLEARFLAELQGDKEVSARRVQQKLEAERQLQEARKELQLVDSNNRDLERQLEAANVEVERLTEGTRSAQRDATGRQSHYRHQMDHLLNESDRLDHHTQLSNQQLVPLKATFSELEQRLDKLIREENLLQGQLDKKIEILAQTDREVKEQHVSTVVPVSDAIPRGIIGVVFCNVENESQLWESIPETMLLSLDTYTKLCRDALKVFNGYEVKSEGDFFMASFRSGLDSLKWAMMVQSSLMVVNWPDRLLATDWCGKVTVNGRPVFRGLRVRMGINEGAAQTKINPVTGRADYFGPEINKAARIASLAAGGQVLVSETVLQRWREDRDLQSNCATTSLGKHALRGFKGLEQIHQILPRQLNERAFPPLQHTPPLAAKQGGERETEKPEAPAPDVKPTVVVKPAEEPPPPPVPPPIVLPSPTSERDMGLLSAARSESDRFETASSSSMYSSARLVTAIKANVLKAKKGATLSKAKPINKKTKSAAALAKDSAKAKADAVIAHQIARDARAEEALIERKRKLNFEAADITLKMYAARDSADALMKKNAEVLARVKNLKEQLGWEVQAKNELHTKVFVWMREEAEREAAIERTFQNLQTLISRQSVLEDQIIVSLKERDGLKRRLEEVQRNTEAWTMLQNMRELDEQLSHEVEVLSQHKEVRETYLARLEALIASMDFLHPARKPLPAPGETPRIVNGVFTRSNSIDLSGDKSDPEKSEATKSAELMQSITNMQLQLLGAKMEKALYGEIGKWLAVQLDGVDGGSLAGDQSFSGMDHSDSDPRLILEDLLLGDEDEEGHELADPITLYAPDESHKLSDINARLGTIQSQVDKEREQANKMEDDFAKLKGTLELECTMNAEKFTETEQELAHCVLAQGFLRQLLMAEYTESSAEVLKRTPIDTTGTNGETRAIAELQARIGEQLNSTADGQQTAQVELLGKILRGETVHVHDLEQAGLTTEPMKSRPSSRGPGGPTRQGTQAALLAPGAGQAAAAGGLQPGSPSASLPTSPLNTARSNASNASSGGSPISPAAGAQGSPRGPNPAGNGYPDGARSAPEKGVSFSPLTNLGSSTSQLGGPGGFARRNSVIGGAEMRGMRRQSIAERGRRPSNAQLTAAQIQSMPQLPQALMQQQLQQQALMQQQQFGPMGAGWVPNNGRPGPRDAMRDLRGSDSVGRPDQDGALGAYGTSPDAISGAFDPQGLVSQGISAHPQGPGPQGMLPHPRDPQGMSTHAPGMSSQGPSQGFAVPGGIPQGMFSQGISPQGYPGMSSQGYSNSGGPGAGRNSPFDRRKSLAANANAPADAASAASNFREQQQAAYGGGPPGSAGPASSGFGPASHPSQQFPGANFAPSPGPLRYTVDPSSLNGAYERQMYPTAGPGPGSYPPGGGHYANGRASTPDSAGGSMGQQGGWGNGGPLPSVQHWGNARQQGFQPGYPAGPASAMSPAQFGGGTPTISTTGPESSSQLPLGIAFPSGYPVNGYSAYGGYSGGNTSRSGSDDGSSGNHQSADGSGDYVEANPPWWSDGGQTGAWGRPQSGFSVAALGSSLATDGNQRRLSATGRDVLYSETPQNRNVMVRENITGAPVVYREAGSFDPNSRHVIIRPANASSPSSAGGATSPGAVSTPANQAQILSALLHGSKLVFPQMDPSILGVQLTGTKLRGPGSQAPRK